MYAMQSQSLSVLDDAFEAHNPYKIHQVEVPFVD